LVPCRGVRYTLVYGCLFRAWDERPEGGFD
jgi:hypothetical protein